MRLTSTLLFLLLLASCGPPAAAPPPAAPPPPPPPGAPAGPPASPLERADEEPAAAPAPAATPTTIETVVVRVVDGDTLVLEGRDRVRVDSINAPEIDEELGLESRDHAVKLVQGKKATITGAKRDGYGRLVGNVVVGGKSLSEELVRAGLAHVYLIPPVDGARAARLLALEAQARKGRLGVWATARYQGTFHITSFHANPRGNEMDDLNSEYVRIANIGGAPQSLKGHTLTNRKGQRFFFRQVVVPAGHTIMVHSGSGEPRLDPAKQLQLYWNRRYPAWSNKGDTATLLDANGKQIDAVEYDPGKKKVYPK